jgi:hypothetical protein
MNQQPDKLFRDKLQSFQTPAPSGAWNRIEANLDKKNDKILWFRIAASLLLVAIAAYLLWPANSINTPQPELAGKTKNQEIVTPEQKKEEQIVAPVPVQENKIAKKEAAPRKRTITKQRDVINEQAQDVERIDETSIAQNANTSVENNTAVDTQAISTLSETQTAVVAVAETQKVKIIFSAEEVDNKYLDKKALAEATSDEKKSSTLKKLLDKAYDLKYNQDPFGDLRQKKNEILALNFRTDKQRK